MDIILQQYNSDLIKRAASIKALIFDVDGVLTNGAIIYSNSGDELKEFNVKDGQIIQHLIKNDIVVGAITGRASALVERRCIELKLDFFFQGIKNKYECLMEELEKHKLNLEEVAYIGDDIIDLKIISKCGLGVTPSDALVYVKEEANLVTKSSGGNGVLREVGDLILASKGLLKEIVENHTK